MRRGWTAKTEQEAAGGSGDGRNKVASYVNALPVFKRGRTFYIEVINPVHYASYVEFGHRTPGGKGWVAGQYFLTLAESQLESRAPAIIEKELEKKLKEVSKSKQRAGEVFILSGSFFMPLQSVILRFRSDLHGKFLYDGSCFCIDPPKGQHPLPILGRVVEHGKPLDRLAMGRGGRRAVIPGHEIALRHHLQACHLFQREGGRWSVCLPEHQPRLRLLHETGAILGKPGKPS